MTARQLSPASLSAILCSSVGLWVSYGALTVAGTGPGAVRIGVLPSFWWLGAAVIGAGAAAIVLRPAPRQVAVLWLSSLLLLPWIPALPAPLAATLVFAGRLRALVWVAIAAGLMAPMAIRAVRNMPIVADPRRAPWVAGVLAAMVYLATAWTISPRLPTGDEPHYLVIAQSLLRDHDLQIENNHARGDYHAFFGPPLKPDYLRRGVNGQIYSIHAPGLPAVVAPVLAVFGYSGVVVLLALISAIATALAWSAVWRVTGDAGASWFGWATVALSVPFVFEAFTVFPDGLGGSIVMAGMLVAVAGAVVSERTLIAAGTALALLPWLHTRFALTAGALAVVISARQLPSADRIRRIASFLIVPAVSGIAWFWFFYAIYGTPSPTAPYGGYTQTSVANIPRGLTGLLLDQQFGILPYAPVYLCALLGFVPLVRRSPRVAGEVALVIVPYAVATAAYFMWWGGFSPPGRFLVSVLLPLSIPAGVWFANARTPARLLGCGAALVSAAVTTALAAVDRGGLVYNERDGASTFLLWLSPLVNLITALPSLFQGGPGTAWLRAVAWLAGIGATAATGALLAARRTSRTVVGVGLGLAAGIFGTTAIASVWAFGDRQPVATARAAPLFLRAIDPSSRQVAVRFDPLRRLRLSEVAALVPIATPGGGGASDPWLSVVEPPAGTYVIEAVVNGDAGRLTAGVDREPGPLWSWDLTGVRGPWRQSVVLPVPALALQIDGDAASRRALSSLSVHAERLAAGPARFSGVEARRAAHYGSATVFLVGGFGFMERAGAWVAGQRDAEFMLFPDSGTTVHLLLRNFAAENAVTLDGSAGRQELLLKPREERTIELAVDRATGAAVVRIKSQGGARPSDVEPGSLDPRMLGCWIEAR
jgi:hypothetical protein